ncbi:MAG: GNAT family N-acetyltransferase, partial [Anaerolineales bacterium]
FIAGDRRDHQQIGWIATIGVLPQFRHQGIGTSLLQECEKHLATQLMRLNVRRSNLEAINLYKNLGYRQISTIPHYYIDGEDAYIFEKVNSP